MNNGDYVPIPKRIYEGTVEHIEKLEAELAKLRAENEQETIRFAEELAKLREERDEWKATADAELKVRNIVSDAGDREVASLNKAIGVAVEKMEIQVEMMRSDSISIAIALLAFDKLASDLEKAMEVRE